jgi:hypothetical protein
MLLHMTVIIRRTAGITLQLRLPRNIQTGLKIWYKPDERIMLYLTTPAMNQQAVDCGEVDHSKRATRRGEGLSVSCEPQQRRLR